MTQRFSNRIESIQASGTVQLSATLETLRSQGADVIDMAVGEPDFAVNSEIITATAVALRDGLTRYGPVGGLTTLRQRIALQFEDCQDARLGCRFLLGQSWNAFHRRDIGPLLVIPEHHCLT